MWPLQAAMTDSLPPLVGCLLARVGSLLPHMDPVLISCENPVCYGTALNVLTVSSAGKQKKQRNVTASWLTNPPPAGSQPIPGNKGSFCSPAMIQRIPSSVLLFPGSLSDSFSQVWRSRESGHHQWRWLTGWLYSVGSGCYSQQWLQQPGTCTFLSFQTSTRRGRSWGAKSVARRVGETCAPASLPLTAMAASQEISLLRLWRSTQTLEHQQESSVMTSHSLTLTLAHRLF